MFPYNVAPIWPSWRAIPVRGRGDSERTFVRFFSTKHGSLGGDNCRSVATWGNSDSIRRLGGTYLIPIARRGSPWWARYFSLCPGKEGRTGHHTFAACSSYLRIRMHIDRLTPSFPTSFLIHLTEVDKHIYIYYDWLPLIDWSRKSGSILGSNEMRVILRFREWAPSQQPAHTCVEWIVQHLRHEPIFDPSALVS